MSLTIETKACAAAFSFAILASIALAVPAGPVTAGKPDFSGTWKLNEKLSENAKKKIRKAFREGFSPGISISGGGDSPEKEQAEMERIESQMAREIAAEMARLVIQHREPQLRVLYASDHLLVLETAGKEVSEARHLATARVRAAWDESSLILKRTLDSGRETEESWRLQPAEKRLVINQRSSGGNLPVVEIRFVYDSAPSP